MVLCSRRETNLEIDVKGTEAAIEAHQFGQHAASLLLITAGNALEVAEAVRFLRNEAREPRLDAVTLSLCAEMLIVAGKETDRGAATARCEEALSSGRAAEAFSRMVAALGGPADFLDKVDAYLQRAPVTRAVHADGILVAVDTRAIGNAIIELGGGRRQVGEPLDLSVGFNDIAPVGARLGTDRPLAVVHAASEADAEIAEKNLLAAVTLADEEPAERPVICEILTG